jgi:hypothetical protein
MKTVNCGRKKSKPRDVKRSILIDRQNQYYENGYFANSMFNAIPYQNSNSIHHRD